MIRIAMWSGPRNISTAMLRSWENRPDTAVCDEPFYAYYLAQTGREHPGADEVMAHHETDPRKIIDRLTGEIVGDPPIYYQKQMAHHLLPQLSRDWLASLTNCFLIRDPREVITSYLREIENPTVDDLGFRQQLELFTWLRREFDVHPPVLDARDFLEHPREMLVKLCEIVEVSFSDSMLQWPAGSRPSDGIWAKYWYKAVEQSTCFAAYRPKPDTVPARLEAVYQECLAYYEQLHPFRLRV